TALAELRNRAFAHEVDGIEIDPHHVAPLRRRCIGKRCHRSLRHARLRPADAGVVDETIESTFGARSRDDRLRTLLRADVGRDRHDLADAALARDRTYVVERVFAAPVHNHRRAARRQQQCCGAPDARAGARHDRDLAFEIAHTTLLESNTRKAPVYWRARQCSGAMLDGTFEDLLTLLDLD